MVQFSTDTLAYDRKNRSALHAWTDIPSVVHGFMTREGGFSSGPYASFNLAESVGDDASAVSANWRVWHTLHPTLRIARLAQVHGNQVHRIDNDFDSARPAGDGMVTGSSRVALGVFSADCVPILMVDPESRVVAALHSGWRGTLLNIAAAGVNAMTELGAVPSRIRAALGPAIGLCCFEVDGELCERFSAKIPKITNYCREGRPGKMHLDLRGIITHQLVETGLAVEAIGNVGPCTRCANDKFFSRRAASGAPTGLQMSFIGFAA